MKKIGLFIVLLSIFMIPVVFAECDDYSFGEKIEVTLCQGGCGYSDVSSLVEATDSSASCKINEVTINIMDNGEYDFSELNYYNDYYIIGNKDNKPSISLGNGTYYIKAMKNVIVGTQGGTEVRGLELDNVLVNGDFYISGDPDMKVINSHFNGRFLLYSNNNGNVIVDNIKVDKYSSFTGNIFISNSEFQDEVDINGTGEMNNSTINSKSLYGLWVRRNMYTICAGHRGTTSNEKSFIVNKVTVSGATLSGIAYEIIDEAYDRFEIKNSDLANNFCSFGAYVANRNCNLYDDDNHPLNSLKNTYKAKLLAVNPEDYDVLIENTKLVCACSMGLEGSDIKPTVYISVNNSWMKSINRTNSVEYFNNGSANVYEKLGAKVLIEVINKDQIVLGNTNYKKINDYFDELKNVPADMITWTVVDGSILKIQNGQIIPLKTGETDIYGSYNNSEYTMHIKVTGTDINDMDSLARHIVNPNTNDQLILVAILLFASLIVYLVGKINRKRIKKIEG